MTNETAQQLNALTEHKGQPGGAAQALHDRLMRIADGLEVYGAPARRLRASQLQDIARAILTLRPAPQAPESKGEPEHHRQAWVALADACVSVSKTGGDVHDLTRAIDRFSDVLMSEVSPQVPEDTALLDFMEERRVSLIPEYEGPWAARQYDDDPQFAADAEGATPRDALRALLEAARKAE